MNSVEQELTHHGVLGMKWGVRRSQKVLDRAAGRKGQSEEYKRGKELRKKGVKNLSNAELKEVTQRMQLEKQFKDLKRGEVSTGRKIATDILKEVGKDLAKDVIRTSAKGGFSNVKSGVDVGLSAARYYANRGRG